MGKTKTEKRNPMKDMVTVFLPRPTGKEESDVFVGLNGKGYLIQRGVPVRVPRPVAGILRESERQAIRQRDYTDKLDAHVREVSTHM